jgi:hypothetical protein
MCSSYSKKCAVLKTLCSSKKEIAQMLMAGGQEQAPAQK